ncbi:LamG-like jellyroll fold domain-containing protein [Bacteroidota bacterium]
MKKIVLIFTVFVCFSFIYPKIILEKNKAQIANISKDLTRPINEINILVLMPGNYGANFFFLKNHFEEYGWNVTYAGITETVQACGWAASNVGSAAFDVDTLISEIVDISQYHCIAVMSASRNVSDPYGDLIASSHALNLINDGAEQGLAIYATCVGVRVLAAADVINGRNITGSSNFSSEYNEAGAIFLGEGIAPVIDENIITTTRGQYFNFQCAQAIATVIENNYQNKIAKSANSNKLLAPKNDDLLWSNTYGASSSEGSRTICETNDGGFIIAGYTYSSGEGCSDIYLVKTDSDGIEQWSKTYGGPGFEYAYSCKAVDDGYIIVGYTTSYGSGSKDIYVVKTDEFGDTTWTNTYGGTGVDVGSSIVKTYDNNYIICGHTESFGQGEDDVYLVKIDSDGNLIWDYTYGGQGPEMGKCIIETTDHNYVICGGSGSFGDGNQDVYFIKINEDGYILTSGIFDYGGDYGGYDFGNSVVESADGGFVFCGSTNWLTHSSNILLIKTDSELHQSWVKIYEESIFYLFGNSAVETLDKDIIVCGNSMLTGKNDLYLLTVDSVGEFKKKEVIGGEFPEWGNSVIISSDNALVTIGHTYSYGAGKSDSWILKTGIISAEVSGNPSSGHAPLNVNFSNQSSTGVESWSWDFNNDGVIDATDQYPSYTFSEPGKYNVFLEINNGYYSQSEVKEDLIRVFDGESALEFNGEDSKLFCSADPGLNFTEKFTFESWIMPYSWGEHNTYSYGTVFNKNYINLFLVNGHNLYEDSCLVIILKHEDDSYSKCWTESNSISLNQWQHLAVSYDYTTRDICVYINGIKQTLEYYAEPNGKIKDNSNLALNFGADSTSSKTFDGIIDEIRLWNVARTETEINENMLYQMSGNEPGLIANWRMDEGSGDTVFSINAYDALIENSRWIQGMNLQTPDNIGYDNYISLFKSISAYPNPASQQISFVFNLDTEASVGISIYNESGQLIKLIPETNFSAGEQTICWNCKDKYGEKVVPGIYICSTISNNATSSISFVIL